MKNKKILTIIVAIMALISSMVFVLTGCTGDDDEITTNQGSGQGNEGGQQVVVPDSDTKTAVDMKAYAQKTAYECAKYYFDNTLFLSMPNGVTTDDFNYVIKCEGNTVKEVTATYIANLSNNQIIAYSAEATIDLPVAKFLAKKFTSYSAVVDNTTLSIKPELVPIANALKTKITNEQVKVEDVKAIRVLKHKTNKNQYICSLYTDYSVTVFEFKIDGETDLSIEEVVKNINNDNFTKLKRKDKYFGDFIVNASSNNVVKPA